MATFVTLLQFTDQGIRNVKETTHRAEAFRGMAAKLGVEVKALFWTTGAYDLVVITEGSEQAALAAGLTVSALGNVRAQTLRAFDAAEMQKIISLMP